MGRWHVIDPAAETYGTFSPYHFAGNNPVRNRELNGAVYARRQQQHAEDTWLRSPGFSNGSSLDYAREQADAYDASVYDYYSNLTYVPGVGSVNKNDILPPTPKNLASIGLSGYYTSSKGKIYSLFINGIGEIDLGGNVSQSSFSANLGTYLFAASVIINAGGQIASFKNIAANKKIIEQTANAIKNLLYWGYNTETLEGLLYNPQLKQISNLSQKLCVYTFLLGTALTAVNGYSEIKQGRDTETVYVEMTAGTAIGAIGTFGGPMGVIAAAIFSAIAIPDGILKQQNPVRYEEIRKSFYGYTDSSGGIHGTDYGEWPMP